jgi:hypothetical protein
MLRGVGVVVVAVGDEELRSKEGIKKLRNHDCCDLASWRLFVLLELLRMSD